MARVKTMYSITHYTSGKGVPFYGSSEERLTIEATFADMFARLRAGAELAFSGFNYGLVTYYGPEFEPTGSDQAIYGGMSARIQDFLIQACRWRLKQREDLGLGSPEYDHFIRQTLLQATGQDFTDEELKFALEMPEDEFLAIVAISVETGEQISELFCS